METKKDITGLSHKGATNNPTGRPKGRKNNTTIVKEILKIKHPKNKKLHDPRYYLFDKAINVIEKSQNEKNRLDALKMLFDRVEGKPKQVVEVGRTEEERDIAAKKLLASIDKGVAKPLLNEIENAEFKEIPQSGD